MKRATALLLALTLFLTACSSAGVESAVVGLVSPLTSGSAASGAAATASQATETPVDALVVAYDRDDLETGVGGADASTIELAGDSIIVAGSGVTVNGRVATITAAGTYRIHGTLNDGQVIVNTEDEETVRLVLNGAHITCSDSAPLYVLNAEKTVLTLAADSENSVSDGSSYILAPGSDEPDAAIFSNDDLTINGNGSLTVRANTNHGIHSQDDLIIMGGHITIHAVNDGLKGRDAIVVREGTITIVAGGDGMQSNNDEDADRGYIVIEDGTFDITAGADGIQAETRLVIGGGDITITAGGGSGARDGSGDSAKGLKAGADITITNGTINVNSADDAIHSNGSITIAGGTITLASGDDAIHADFSLEINGGDIGIVRCYEGIESATITINGGNIHLAASDDGINAVRGNDGAFMGGPGGQNPFEFSGDSTLTVNGGTVFVDAAGDGLDINGSIVMTGGEVIINGPTRNDNGAVDYLGTFEISGGLLVAVGSAGMAQAPSASSSQYSLALVAPSVLAAGTILHIETASGEEVLTFAPTKAYQAVVFSSPDLQNGATYVVYTGGSSTGAMTDGLSCGGAYTPGTQLTTLTISSMVTGSGFFGGGFPGGRGGGFPGGGRPGGPRP